MLKFSLALQSPIAETLAELWTAVGMRWAQPSSRTAGTMEVTAPWPFCTCDVLAKPEFPTPFLTAARLFLTPSLLSNSSFPELKKSPFTQAFPFPTFPTRCTSQPCLHKPQPFKTVRTFPVPAIFHTSLYQPAKSNILSRLPSTQKCLWYPPLLGLLPLQRSSTLASTAYLSLQNQFIFLWRQKTKIKFSN